MRVRLFCASSVVASGAMAAEPDFAKTDFLIDHPAATITEDSLTCRSQEDYSRMMSLLRDDQDAAKSFVMSKVRTGACMPIKKGTQILVEEANTLKPMKFRIKGKPTQLWIYADVVEPNDHPKK